MSQPGEQDKDPLLGRTVGKYRLARLIGVGGMGRVYEGVHHELGKSVALKFIDKENLTDEAVQRFQREARAASSVDSSHIVEIYDVGTTDDGLPYIVMELLRGEDLGHRIRRLGRLDVPEALRVGAHVLRGLARAHEAGIVHRDLKPDNVFLVSRDDDDCFAKLLDFGVSKIQKNHGISQTITREGVVLGTPVYMSPEQAQAHPDVDQRSDLWAVGAILFECLTGRLPFSGASYEAVIVNICSKDPDDVRLHNPEVSPGLAAVLRRALMRDKEARYATARDMLDALVAESDGVLAISLKSDSLKRVVVSDPSSSKRHEGPMTLAAVSTVAAAPAPTAAGSARRSSAVLFGVAGIAVAAGGISAGIMFSRSGAATPSTPAVEPPQVVVVKEVKFLPAESAASTSATSPAPQVEPSGSALASAAALAEAPRKAGARVVERKGAAPSAVVSAGPVVPGPDVSRGIGDGLKLREK